MITTRRLAAMFALVMMLSTAAFVIGVTVEKNQRHSEPGVEETHTDEGSEAHEEGEAAESNSEESETMGGIDLESTPLVVFGAAGSLALAGAVLRWPRREAFAVALAFCLGIAILDGRELVHQLDEDSGGVAALARLTLLLHLAAAAIAALALTRKYGDTPAPA